jgi:hypothetical protein
MSRQIRGDSRPYIEHWVHLDNIYTNDFIPLDDCNQRIPQFGVRHAIGFSRNTAGHQGRVQNVDVDADVTGRTNRRQPIRAVARSKIVHPDHLVAVCNRIAYVLHRISETADTDLCDAFDVRHLTDMTDRMHVGIDKAMLERRVVNVRVEVHNMEWTFERADDGVGDGMVTTEHDRDGTHIKNLANGLGYSPKGQLHVGRRNIDVARVDETSVLEDVAKVCPPGTLVEVSLCSEPHRMFANGPWGKS